MKFGDFHLFFPFLFYIYISAKLTLEVNGRTGKSANKKNDSFYYDIFKCKLYAFFCTLFMSCKRNLILCFIRMCNKVFIIMNKLTNYLGEMNPN